MANILIHFIRIYLPITIVMSIIVAIIGPFPAVLFGIIFAVIQSIAVEFANFLEGMRIDDINFDIAPFAGILITYYYSFPAALVVMFALLIIQDIDVDVNIFSELEDVAFNILVMGAAFFFRNAEFLSLAIILIIIRYFVINLVHGILTRDFSPKKYFLEGITGLVFVFGFRILQAIA